MSPRSVSASNKVLDISDESGAAVEYSRPKAYSAARIIGVLPEPCEPTAPSFLRPWSCRRASLPRWICAKSSDAPRLSKSISAAVTEPSWLPSPSEIRSGIFLAWSVWRVAGGALRGRSGNGNCRTRASFDSRSCTRCNTFFHANPWMSFTFSFRTRGRSDVIKIVALSRKNFFALPRARCVRTANCGSRLITRNTLRRWSAWRGASRSSPRSRVAHGEALPSTTFEGRFRESGMEIYRLSLRKTSGRR